MPSQQPTNSAQGEYILQEAVQLAQHYWPERLLAAYALGSLAHGGFSPLVSDVDLGLIIHDPLESSDAQAIDELVSAIKRSAAPLADRLSLFWGSLATLTGQQHGGRFPALDLLDLKQHGYLLTGSDIRAQLPTPEIRELIVSGAAFALKQLSSPQVITELKNPQLLIQAGVKLLTKRILFPIRFLYTAQTGQIGTNDAAAAYFSKTHSGPAAHLAQKGFDWRSQAPSPHDPGLLESLQQGLLPLYRLFLDDYIVRLESYGEQELAHSLRTWREMLG